MVLATMIAALLAGAYLIVDRAGPAKDAGDRGDFAAFH
jgi:hypothetical protein